MKKGNLFTDYSAADKHKGEFAQTLLSSASKKCHIERIVSRADISPDGFWYCQEDDEFVAILSGNAIIEFDTFSLDMIAGDYIIIEKNMRHRVAFTSKNPPCVWLTVFVS